MNRQCMSLDHSHLGSVDGGGNVLPRADSVKRASSLGFKRRRISPLKVRRDTIIKFIPAAQLDKERQTWQSTPPCVRLGSLEHLHRIAAVSDGSEKSLLEQRDWMGQQI